MLFTEVQHRPHVRQGLRCDNAIDDEAITEFPLVRGIGSDVAQYVVRYTSCRADDVAPDAGIGGIKADDESIEKWQNGFMIVQQAGVGQQGEMSEFHFALGASDELVDVGMQQRLAASEDKAVDASTDDLEHAQSPIEIEWFFGLRIAPRAEVFAVGAIKVALRGDVIRGDQRLKHTTATGESGEVKQIIGDRRCHIREIGHRKTEAQSLLESSPFLIHSKRGGAPGAMPHKF